MKKFLSFVFLSVLLSVCFAQEEKKWTHIITPGIQLSTKNFSNIDNGNGNTHFAEIEKINLPTPNFQSLSIYSIPLYLGDNIIFTGSNLSFIIGSTISPLTLDLSTGGNVCAFPIP